MEIRYSSRLVRTLASLSYITSIVLYMGVVLYTPCLALKTVTGLPLLSLIVMGGVIGTFYTVLVSKFVMRKKKGKIEAWCPCYT